MAKTTLTAASRQWAQRPADQRFWTVTELMERTKKYADESKVAKVALNQCQVMATKQDDLMLGGPQGGLAEFQHYAFGQFASICQAPAAYLRELPAPLAAANLNHGLSRVQGEQSLLFHKNGGLHLRCVTSEEYKRIWNWEIAELALALEEGEGWRTPPARPCNLPGVPVRTATETDVLRKSAHPTLGIQVGDDISPSGLYASDHDCFIFQVNESTSIDGGDGEQMYRGVFWSNSEVGDAKWRGTFFLYDTVCGNHIVWGAKVLQEIAFPHRGNAREMFQVAMANATERILDGIEDDEERIRLAKRYELAPSREELITRVFNKQINLSKKECEQAYTLAECYEDMHGNNPRSAWGYAAGVTRLSQNVYADERNRMDRAAGRIMEMAF
jgi:hypothetical protein